VGGVVGGLGGGGREKIKLGFNRLWGLTTINDLISGKSGCMHPSGKIERGEQKKGFT